MRPSRRLSSTAGSRRVTAGFEGRGAGLLEGTVESGQPAFNTTARSLHNGACE